jgi:hypothetical protein
MVNKNNKTLVSNKKYNEICNEKIKNRVVNK